jgi:hypothetical protein
LNRLRQLWSYARKGYDLGRRLRQTRDGRQYPEIPTPVVVPSLFLGALLRVPSWLQLAKETRKAAWQRIVRHAKPLNHEVFNYVSEFLRWDDLREHLYALARTAKANKALAGDKICGYHVLALDANEPFASRSRCCPDCCTRRVTVKGADGQEYQETEYYHRAVFAHLVGSDLILDLEPLRPGEEECAAALRLLARLRRRLGVRFFDVITVDAWYTKSPFIRAVQKLGWKVVAVLKQREYEAYGEADALRPQAAQETLEVEGRRVALREVRDVHLTQNNPDTLRVVLSDEQWEQRRRRGQTWQHVPRQSHWRWVATADLDHVPARGIWQMGHGRWGVENQTFNRLTRDYHLGHCYHHHPVAIWAWLLITLLAANLTTLFVRHWMAPRAEPGFSVSDFIKQLYANLEWETDWEHCLDSG